MNTFINNNKFNKKKVVFIMGATRMRKFRLSFLKNQRVPIIVGGSNSYIEKLVEDPVFMFKYKYDTRFIWIDVVQSVLNHRVGMRIDQMVNAVDEVRQIFIPDADYTKGIRRSIDVPKMDSYLREETNIYEDDDSKKMLLQSLISNIKRERKEVVDEAWRNTILQSCLDIVKRFLKSDDHNIIIE
ncbi:hypothetical protein H5410_021530 [Solanum commersonii]|uniref:Uncharacterized protein n=1 Tax=Solanum commersonii TaxID=4109 RepID=A0A9J5ZBL9_SOLCO|nr:hypothetical protein H5410_021530 [Solanum commersonii]